MPRKAPTESKTYPTVLPEDQIRLVGGPLDGHELPADRIRCLHFFILTDLPSKPFYVCDHRDGDGVLIFLHFGSASQLYEEVKS